MASEKAIAMALGVLGEAFPTKEVTRLTGDVWAKVFASASDEALEKAVLRVCSEPNRRFFPSTGEIFGAMAKGQPPIDSVQVLHRIAQLGFYDPHRGWVYPTPEIVRERLGDDIANAYTSVGRETVFSDETVTRDIARREFAQELEAAQERQPERPLPPPANQLLLPPPQESWPERKPRALNPGDKSPLAETIRRLTKGATAQEPAS